MPKAIDPIGFEKMSENTCVVNLFYNYKYLRECILINLCGLFFLFASSWIFVSIGIHQQPHLINRIGSFFDVFLSSNFEARYARNRLHASISLLTVVSLLRGRRRQREVSDTSLSLVHTAADSLDPEIAFFWGGRLKIQRSVFCCHRETAFRDSTRRYVSLEHF